MPGNVTQVGLGDKWVSSYPLNKIESQPIKDAIKGALNQAMSCRVSIETTRKPCDGSAVAFGGGTPMSLATAAGSGHSHSPGEVPPQLREGTIVEIGALESDHPSTDLSLPMPYRRATSGEMIYRFLPMAHAPGGRRCCKIVSISAAPIPIAGLSVVVQLAGIAGVPAGASISFQATAAGEIVGLDKPNECDLDCETDTASGSVELVINGSITATFALGPLGAGIAFALKDLRIPMGAFSMRCGTPLALT